MNAPSTTVAVGTFNSLTALTRYAIFLLLTLAVTLFPAREAKAESAIDVLLKVCAQIGDVCGPIESAKAVANNCFKKSGDELACAVAIISVASGGQEKEGIKQVNAVISCIKAVPDLTNKAKFDATCRPLLQAAGVNVGKIDEVYGIASKCGNADDVDDFIYCADTLIDSSFADDADLGIPSWVDSLFEIYIDIDQKDYWGLVYNVGATVACAVANYFTGNDVCAFLADIAEFAGDVADGAKAVGGALNNAGEKVFTNQKQHVPVVQYFNENWLPDVDTYANAIVVQKNTGYWSGNVGAKFNSCVAYFDSHTMSEDKATRACSDMRDGTAASDNSFIDKGFSQLASRRGAIMLLPSLVKSAAQARIAQLRTQGAFKATPLNGSQAQLDPWKSAQEVPGVEGAVYRAYGLPNGNLEEPPLKRDAKTVNEAWRTKTVGYGAYMIAQAAKVAPATLNFPVSEEIAKKAIASSESVVDIAAEVRTFIASAQAERMKTVDAFVNINKGLKDSLEKPLKEALALCIPKATAVCEAEVRERFKVCDAKAKAFYDANAALIGDFDSKQGQNAIKKWEEIRATCEAAVVAYVNALPNVTVNAAETASCKLFLNRPDELICADAASTLACHKQVDIGKLKSCRQPGTQQVYTKSTGPLATGPGTIQPNPGGTGKAPATLGSGALLGGGAATGGGQKPGTVSPLPPTLPLKPPAVTALAKPKVDEAALAQCKLFQGRKDELLCPDTRALTACKAMVDSGKMKTCRQTGSQTVYPNR